MADLRNIYLAREEVTGSWRKWEVS